MTNYDDLNKVDRLILQILQPGRKEKVEKTTKEISDRIDDRDRSYISQRLSALRDKDIIRKRKDGRKNFYSVKETDDQFAERVVAIQKTIDIAETADFQEIDINNIYNSSSMLKKKYGLDAFGLPEELSLEDIAIPDEDLPEDKNALNVLLAVINQVNDQSEEYWSESLEDFYEETADDLFEGDELEDALEKEEWVLDILMQSATYSLDSMEINLESDSGDVNIKTDSLEYAYVEHLDSDNFPSGDKTKVAELLRKLEEKYREMKKLQIVLRNA